MAFDSSLEFVEQISELHADDQTGHAEEYVAPTLKLQQKNLISESLKQILSLHFIAIPQFSTMQC